MQRTLFITKDGIEKEAVLTMEGPRPDPYAGWACDWKCDIIHPQVKTVHGSDEMSALYFCLNFIGAFIHNMEAFGYKTRYEMDGDCGGFDFGKGVPANSSNL